MCVCVCVCVSKGESCCKMERIEKGTVCVCVCVCVGVLQLVRDFNLWNVCTRTDYLILIYYLIS